MSLPFISSLFWKSINDELFGLLKFNRLTNECWKGKINFDPTGNKIDIYLFDLKDEVSEEHYQFYKELKKRYFEITNEIAEILQQPNTSIGYLPHKNFERFKLVGLSFPRVKELKKNSFEWDMYYSYNPEKPNFLVGMKNWKPDKNEFYSGE